MFSYKCATLLCRECNVPKGAVYMMGHPEPQVFSVVVKGPIGPLEES